MVVKKERNEVLALDLLWSFFISALHSYRYDSILRPYPQKYVNQETQEKDVKQLRKVATQVPSVSKLLEEQDSLSPEAVELFNWVISSSSYRLEYKSASEFKTIKELTKQIVPAAEPNHIFQVFHSEKREIKFQEMKDEMGSVYAYHGSKLQNFYSILRNGLVSHLSKNGAFGSGTYFSSELSVSLLYSYSSKSWERSLLGADLSCVAVCEIIKDPSVKFKVKGKPISPSDLIDENVPDKYFIVLNDELVILRYLLVYSFGSSQKNKVTSSWWRKHMFAIFLVCYVAILCAMTLSR